jgi:hypothetical protein
MRCSGEGPTISFNSSKSDREDIWLRCDDDHVEYFLNPPETPPTYVKFDFETKHLWLKQQWNCDDPTGRKPYVMVFGMTLVIPLETC